MSTIILPDEQIYFRRPKRTSDKYSYCCLFWTKRRPDLILSFFARPANLFTFNNIGDSVLFNIPEDGLWRLAYCFVHFERSIIYDATLLSDGEVTFFEQYIRNEKNIHHRR